MRAARFAVQSGLLKSLGHELEPVHTKVRGFALERVRCKRRLRRNADPGKHGCQAPVGAGLNLDIGFWPAGAPALQGTVHSCRAGAPAGLVDEELAREVLGGRAPFHDKSGDRLREWLGLTREEFYDPTKIAILPMGFCYPGTGKSGDLPPRPECEPAWRSSISWSFRNVSTASAQRRCPIRARPRS